MIPRALIAAFLLVLAVMQLQQGRVLNATKSVLSQLAQPPPE